MGARRAGGGGAGGVIAAMLAVRIGVRGARVGGAGVARGRVAAPQAAGEGACPPLPHRRDPRWARRPPGAAAGRGVRDRARHRARARGVGTDPGRRACARRHGTHDAHARSAGHHAREGRAGTRVIGATAGAGRGAAAGAATVARMRVRGCPRIKKVIHEPKKGKNNNSENAFPSDLGRSMASSVPRGRARAVPPPPRQSDAVRQLRWLRPRSPRLLGLCARAAAFGWTRASPSSSAAVMCIVRIAGASGPSGG